MPSTVFRIFHALFKIIFKTDYEMDPIIVLIDLQKKTQKLREI